MCTSAREREHIKVKVQKQQNRDADILTKTGLNCTETELKLTWFDILVYDFSSLGLAGTPVKKYSQLFSSNFQIPMG